MSRIVVTGYGAVTPLGVTADATWQALLSGDSGVRPLTEPWAAELPVRIAADVIGDFTAGLATRELKRMDRAEQFALVAGREAWVDAGQPDMDPDRLAVIVGTAVGGMATTLAQNKVLNEAGSRRVSPHTVTMLMANGPAAWLSIDLGARGGARTPVSACTSGAEAIMMGREMILAGTADIVLCGGTEAPIGAFGLASFAAARAMSTKNDDFRHASRPFDINRDGFVLGEGASILVLEREEHAVARHARIHGVVSGAALTSDAIDIVKGDPTNQSRTMRLALATAGLAADDIGFVHAHGTSTPVGDLNEATAINEALPGLPPVTATKSSTGHLLGASGALGALATVMALDERVIPPTINVKEQDPQIELDVVRDLPRATAAQHAVVNSFGFGGHSASLVLSRP